MLCFELAAELRPRKVRNDQVLISSDQTEGGGRPGGSDWADWSEMCEEETKQGRSRAGGGQSGPVGLNRSGENMMAVTLQSLIFPHQLLPHHSPLLFRTSTS